MDLVLDIASSIEFWRKLYPLDRTPGTPVLRPQLQCAYSQDDAWKLIPEWAAPTCAYYGMLHLLVFDSAFKRHSQTHATHAWSGPVPEGAFFALRPNVYVESPEFMFLHAATILDFETLIAFGDELCGFYSFDEREKRGFRRRSAPLTSTKKIAQLLAKTASGSPGMSIAKRALQYVVDGSASPMETFDEMTMCLPRCYGGYKLPTATMNQEVILTPRAARIANRERCYLDMGYLEHNLDVEHHGKYDHSEEDERSSDRARVNGLKDMGIEVIELTKDQVNDLYAYELIIERIAKILNVRIRKSCKGATEARLKLRKAIVDWNSSSGRIR